MPDEIAVIIRTVVSFCMLLFAARFLGKQTISQMTIFDFIASITLGAMAAGLAYNITLKPHYMVLAFLIFVFVIYIIALISVKSRKWRKFFAGDPTVVIQNGKILESNMRKMRYSIDYMNQQLREKDCFSIDEVLFAIVETNGTLTVRKKPQYRPVTRKDLLIAVKPETRMEIDLIIDGKIIRKNLEENGIQQAWLMSELRNRALQVKDVVYAVLLSDGNVYFDTYKDHLSSPIDRE